VLELKQILADEGIINVVVHRISTTPGTARVVVAAAKAPGRCHMSICDRVCCNEVSSH